MGLSGAGGEYFSSCRGAVPWQAKESLPSWCSLLCLPGTQLKAQSFSLGLTTNANSSHVKRSILLKISYKFNTTLIQT